MKTKEEIKKEFEKILKEWNMFEAYYDNDMAAAGIEAPIHPFDWFYDLLTTSQERAGAEGYKKGFIDGQLVP